MTLSYNFQNVFVINFQFISAIISYKIDDISFEEHQMKFPDAVSVAANI